MRHAIRFHCHPVALVALTAALWAVAPGAHASDAPASAAEAPAKAKAKSESSADPHTKPKAEAAVTEPTKPVARARPVQDPMDVIRERLAEKLGAAKTPESAANVVRVVSKASAAPAAVDAIRASSVRHGPAPAAARSNVALATQQREAPSGNANHGAGAAHWDYAGSGGPESWGRMKPEFSACSSGSRQSPIDIRDGIKVNLDPVQFDYKPSAFRVIDNGHTVQVNVGPGNSIEVLGRRYDLLQFHFHRPSEERIDGKQFDMVAHLVHKDLEGRLAVVAVLLERGSAHALVQSVWNNLPLEKGEDVAARTTIDLSALLPAERSYFTYMGSLTTPPCSEGVLWMVMKTPMPISGDQIGIFARLYPMNARPVQSAAGRLIKESN